MNKKEFKHLQSSINSITDKHEQKLAQGYLDTLESVQLQLSEVYTKHSSDNIQYANLKGIRKDLTKKINELTPIQNNIIRDQIKDVYEETYYLNAYSIDKQTGLSKSTYALLSHKIIQDKMYNPRDKMKWIDRQLRNNKQLSNSLKKVLRSGIANGQSYDKVANEVSKQFSIGRRRAIKIAQTETGRVYSDAKQDSMEHAITNGIELKKRWICTLDSLTRDSHQQLDGQTINVDDMFISPSGQTTKAPHGFGDPKEDINCRCDVITIFEGLEPTKRMAREEDNKLGKRIEYVNYPEWKASLK